MRKKRVLLLSEGFGSGHTQAAHALSEGIRALNPNIHTKVIELGSFLNPVVAPIIISAYRKTVSSRPKVVGMMYRSNYKKSTNRFAGLVLHRMFYTQAWSLINQIKPELVICTHPVPNMIIARLKRQQLQTPLLTVITDYDAHSSWVNDEVNRYLVSSEAVKHSLLEKGIDEAKITITGIPVKPKFWENHNKQQLRMQCNLADIPTVLVMGGGWGLLHEDSALSYITKWSESTQIIICVGSNEQMKEKLQSNPSFQHPNIHIIGFTDEVDKLMELSDLLITKPGGMTCTEGFSKGLPMLFYDPIPGQEEKNCEHFINMGFGEMLTSNDTIDKWFKLIHDREALAQLRNQLLKTRDEHYDPEDCSRAVLQYL